MSTEEDGVHLDFGNIEPPITCDRLNSKDAVSVATYMGMAIVSVFLCMAYLSTKFNLHNPRISERKIQHRVKNFGIGILSIVKIPCRRLCKCLPRVYNRVFGYSFRRLQDTFNAFLRDFCAIGHFCIAIIRGNLLYGYRQLIGILKLFNIFFQDFIQNAYVAVIQVLILALHVVFNRLVMIVIIGVCLFFTSVPCCVPWFVKRPVLVQDNNATSEPCYNSPIQRACNCNLNFPKRPSLNVNNAASFDFVYG